MQYLGRNRLPEKFLTAYGIPEGHATLYNWGIIVIPPKLFMKIAVIENIAKTPTIYSLKSFTVASDEDQTLREETSHANIKIIDLPFPPGAISHREKIVIPLSLEFRESTDYGRDDHPFAILPDRKVEAFIVRALARISDGIPFIDQQRYPFATKLKTNFYNPKSPEPATNFYYGPRFELKSAMIDDKLIPIRPPMARGIYMIAGFQGGSCPILYTRAIDDINVVKVGPVLVKANERRFEKTEIVRLPKDIAEVILSEEEPEITNLTGLEVKAIYKEGGSRIVIKTDKPQTILPGKYFSLKIPADTSANYFELRISGYYETFSSILAHQQGDQIDILKN